MIKNIELILLEGNIGAGKTTVLRKLNEMLDHDSLEYNVIIMEEPVEEWSNVGGNNLLKWFYTNMETYGFQFETFVASIRIHNILQLFETIDKTKKTYIIIERSLWIQRHCFAQFHKNRLPPKIMNLLEKIIDTMTEELDTTCNKTFVYLDVPTTECHNRIKQRGRQGEELIELEYLSILRDYHEEYLYRICQDQVYVVKTSEECSNKLMELIN